jgi:CRP-like cAMP-binding protein
MLSNNVEEREKQLLDLAYNTVRKRVANALVRLYDKYHAEGEPDFSISISREDLASMVGTATESAIRMLSEFKSSGLIEIQGSEIKLIEVEKLRKAPY